MSETTKSTYQSATLSGKILPHRQLLSNIDREFDSSSDQEATTDDELDHLDSSHDNGEADSLFEISMGVAQDHMKSVHTPAFEKAQVLAESNGYFDSAPAVGDPESEGPSSGVQPNLDGEYADLQEALPTPWKSQPEQTKQSSITRALFGNGQTNHRPRSSSGSTTIIGGLRKFFTDLPTYPDFGTTVKQEDEGDGSNIGEKGTCSEGQGSRVRSRSVVQPQEQGANGTDSNHNLSTGEQRNHRPSPLRRATSDRSLYLKRAATGASDFDNTSVFANVAEMQNPRFKAISDSLADSSIRMPKMPSMTFSSPWSTPSRTNDDVTSRNTVSNSTTRYTSKSTEGGLPQPSNDQNHTLPIEKRNPILKEALSRLTGDLVVMGGYRGSVLRSAELPHHQLWVPVKVGLNLRKVDLEVGLTREDEEHMEEKIIPSGILSHIGPIDIARRLLKKIRKSPNVKSGQLRLHDYGYDWRLSPHLLSQWFIKFLEGLECNSPNIPAAKRGAWVLAHSLGGVITRHVINQRPDLFAGVIYAGAPQNCCNILGPLRNGDDVLLSSRVLTAQVNFSLRTSYALLPEDGRCFLNKETGERYDVDFFDLNTWDEYRLSPCINPPLPPFVPPQPRKSIVGSMTDSISSFTPSFSSKRSSWFSTSTTPLSSETTASPPPRNTFKGKALNAKDHVEDITKSAAEGVKSPELEAQDGLEPSMKSSSSHKPAIATAVTIPKDKAREYLARTLAEIKQFKAELRHVPAYQEANRYPPNAIIFGKSVPTVYGAKVASREAIKCADAFDNLAFAAGDGVVLASAAQLPTGYRCVKGGRVESDRGHIGLLGDLEGLGKCMLAIIEGRKRGIGLGVPTA